MDFQALVDTLSKRKKRLEVKTLYNTLFEVGTKTLVEKVSMVKTKALVDTLAYRVKDFEVQALCYTLAKVDALYTH